MAVEVVWFEFIIHSVYRANASLLFPVTHTYMYFLF